MQWRRDMPLAHRAAVSALQFDDVVPMVELDVTGQIDAGCDHTVSQAQQGTRGAAGTDEAGIFTIGEQRYSAAAQRGSYPGLAEMPSEARPLHPPLLLY